MILIYERNNRKHWAVGERKYEQLKKRLAHTVIGIINPSPFFRRKTLFCIEDEAERLAIRIARTNADKPFTEEMMRRHFNEIVAFKKMIAADNIKD